LSAEKPTQAREIVLLITEETGSNEPVELQSKNKYSTGAKREKCALTGRNSMQGLPFTE